jgi:hypothetical protein
MPLYCTKPLQCGEGNVYIRAQAERMHVTVGDGKEMLNITPGAFVGAGDPVPTKPVLTMETMAGFLNMEFVRPVNGICTFYLDHAAATDSLRVWVENPTPPFIHITTDGIGDWADGTRTHRVIHLHDMSLRGLPDEQAPLGT